MERKFTKGEWGVNSANKSEVNTFNGIAIADCSKSLMITNDEKEANAKLIAAAPEMFNALCEIYHDKETLSDLFDSQRELVEKALKKATE